MSDGKNPVMGVITFGSAQSDGLKVSLKAETLTDATDLPVIDVPSIMRAAGLDEGLEAAAKLLEARMCEVRGTAEHNLIHELGPLVEQIRAMKRKP